MLFGCGVTDFAGSAVVHLCGGTAAFWATFFLGPRRSPNSVLPPYSYVFQALGTLILWFGWYGFNGASTLYIVGYGQVAAKVMVVTTIAAASGAVSTLYFAAVYDKYVDHIDEQITVRLGNATNGVLAGLVAVTAGCAVVDPAGALVIGILAAPVYVLSSKHLCRIRCFGADGAWGTGTIDDVIFAIPVHGSCGLYGTVMAGLLGTEKNYARAYFSDRASECAGVFYGGSGAALGANLVFIAAVIGWVTMCSVVVFGGLKCVGLIRVNEEVSHMVNLGV